MKKTYQMEALDCANCAAKMEAAIKKIEGVNDASVSFMMQKLTLDVAEDSLDAVLKKAQKVCKKIESDCRILV